jgi:hypothetical protein
MTNKNRPTNHPSNRILDYRLEAHWPENSEPETGCLVCDAPFWKKRGMKREVETRAFWMALAIVVPEETKPRGWICTACASTEALHLYRVDAAGFAWWVEHQPEAENNEAC